MMIITIIILRTEISFQISTHVRHHDTNLLIDSYSSLLHTISANTHKSVSLEQREQVCTSEHPVISELKGFFICSKNKIKKSYGNFVKVYYNKHHKFRTPSSIVFYCWVQQWTISHYGIKLLDSLLVLSGPKASDTRCNGFWGNYQDHNFCGTAHTRLKENVSVWHHFFHCSSCFFYTITTITIQVFEGKTAVSSFSIH